MDEGIQQAKSKFAELEKEVLDYWRQNKVFEKSLNKPSPKGDFVFYDGPPFANGLPHYGHLLASVIKDVVPRYKTMRGYRVPRRWGWDCHGLPVENFVEKELGLKAKSEIEKFGVEKFNAAAKKSVMRFSKEWREFIERTGRWVDMENDYRTMDSSYTETVWWIFKTLHEKNLIYEGFKSMYLCPRCGTTLSNFEVSQGYKDTKDIAVYPKFELKDEPGTFFVAWTTTPWTLPGNAALAVNKDLTYAKVLYQGANYIVAENLIGKVFGEGASTASISGKIKGTELVGKFYKPLFDYYAKDDRLKNKENGWKVYAADFVSIEEGTGIVHIAPAFGEDDLKLGQERKLPFIQHVDSAGRFKKEVSDFPDLMVKPKENPIQTDIIVLKNLAARGLVFKKENVSHSYPFCWRCETPLLNYASSSWFVKVKSIKDKLVAANKNINWVPDDIKEGRFGNWLSGARDWAISRSRYWGAPIPVWKCGKCNRVKVVGSVRDIKGKPSANTFILMRHGESENNVAEILNSDPGKIFHLTPKGEEQVKAAGQSLKTKRIDMIYSSPIVRTRETAEKVAVIIGFPKEKIIFDERLGEIKFGVFEGSSLKNYVKRLKDREEKFVTAPAGGESHLALKNRVGAFLKEIDSKHVGKNILIVDHDGPIWMMAAAAKGLNIKEILKTKKSGEDFLKNAEIRELVYEKVPRNDDFELDLHRPFIDEVVLTCGCGGEMRRVPEVFDCWFESGSMPYSSHHYPFDSARGRPFENVFEPRSSLFTRAKGFPADFIAEGLDQTRGWFYSMLVLSVALFGKSSYKNVVVNGIMLAEDGQKMSKRLQNYPDPLTIIDRYSADALRYFLVSSPLVRAQDMSFSEKSVSEVSKKVLGRLDNVLAFYKLYSSPSDVASYKLQVTSVLDRWIIARLDELIKSVTEAMDKYELDKASRPIGDFVDDLSTWYLRRSRDRFKNDNEDDKNSAKATTRFVLKELSKVLAPFMPFYAEFLYGEIGGEKGSVHLADWPTVSSKLKNQDSKLLEGMRETRRVVSLALEARAKSNMKVRQPLSILKIKTGKIKIEKEMLNLVADEVNVKEVSYDNSISADIDLDLVITPGLREEGDVRETIRAIQELRKEMKLKPGEQKNLATSKAVAATGLVQKHEEEIKKAASIAKIEHGVAAEADFELR